jgi:hypothetical protein
MFDARIHPPVTSAAAVGTVARAGGLPHGRWPEMALLAVPLPQYRGITR